MMNLRPEGMSREEKKSTNSITAMYLLCLILVTAASTMNLAVSLLDDETELTIKFIPHFNIHYFIFVGIFLALLIPYN